MNKIGNDGALGVAQGHGIVLRRCCGPSQDLNAEHAVSAAGRAAVGDKNAGWVKLQRINAGCTKELAGFALFPDDRRAANTALHVDHFGIKALVQWVGVPAFTYCDTDRICLLVADTGHM